MDAAAPEPPRPSPSAIYPNPLHRRGSGAWLSHGWTDLAYQERQTGNTAVFIFALLVLLVFLVLAAQYESWSLPFAIILIVPMSVLSALIGVSIRGMDNNILTQIGLVVLVGLAAKNHIQRRLRGGSVRAGGRCSGS